MKILILAIVVASVYAADTFVMWTDKINDKGNTFYISTICKNGYIYTIIKDEGKDKVSMTQEFERKGGQPTKCPTDIKSQEQLDEINKDR